MTTGSNLEVETEFDRQEALQLLEHHWGYDEFYPYQEETIAAVQAGRDSVTVVPTGGGKSLCYQLPAMLEPGVAVVISPLISLMQDQVESLSERKVSAEYVNSTLDAGQRRAVYEKLQRGTVDLLYIAPERLEMDSMKRLLRGVSVSYFAIDEAHCISHWGHDFRKSYRQLGDLKKVFSDVPIHSFTATATPQVLEDIQEQLNLVDPFVHVANVDRENITYRVRRRTSRKQQILTVLKNHRGEAGIIYCLRRRDVDDLTDSLHQEGIDALPYHAGMSDARRETNQEQFMTGERDLVVATIAFGMGIDRADIRFVIHANMPKTMEHYQQQTGRAGRDGRPSFCYLFFSGGDYGTWKQILKDTSNRDTMQEKLNAVYSYCVNPQCRHRFLVEYFGQEYDRDNCGACDVCRDEVELVEEPLIVGQKILSCVARVDQRFGAGHVTDVLTGKRTDKVEKWNHVDLSTFGLMEDRTRNFLRNIIDQMLGLGYLRREMKYHTLKITKRGKKVLRGEEEPKLAKPLSGKKKREIRKDQQEDQEKSWENEDRELFQALKELRLDLAREKGVPAYVVFPDRSLHEMAARKPTTLGEFAEVHGVGDVKRDQYGEAFLEVIRGH